MKIAIISHWGDGLALGLRLLREGHQVRCYVKDALYAMQLDGAFIHNSTIANIIRWKPDFAFADQTELANEMAGLKGAGISTFGGTAFHTHLEHKRFESLDFAFQHNVPVPATIGFKPGDEKKAMQLLAKEKQDYIIKFDKGDSASSFMARNNDDIAHFLEQHPPKGPFILQEKVDCAVELNTEYWFSNGDFTGIAVGGLEQKKWLAGNLGQNVGCASNISWVYKNVPKIGKKLFTPKLLEALKKARYSGPLDMAAIIDKSGKPWFIEFTPRLGYSAVYDMQELLDSSLAYFFYHIATGKSMARSFNQEAFACSIPVSIAPYPYEWPSHYIADERIYADKPGVVEHFWPFDCKVLGNWEGYATVGTSGLLGYVTASGDVPEAAVALAMSRVKSLEVSDLQYRIDAGSQADKLKVLDDLGYSPRP